MLKYENRFIPIKYVHLGTIDIVVSSHSIQISAILQHNLSEATNILDGFKRNVRARVRAHFDISN